MTKTEPLHAPGCHLIASQWLGSDAVGLRQGEA